jgi:uncharacterized protein (DUF1330 family)
MKTYYTVALAMTVGFGLGVAVNGVNAQGKVSKAYVIVDTSAISDVEAYKQVGPKAGPVAASTGGIYLARSENITALHGTAPKQFVIIAFDSIEKAKAWDVLAEKEVAPIADKASTQRRFIVEGMVEGM